MKTTHQLRWFRAETKAPNIAEPFVDWYKAPSEAAALALAKADLREHMPASSTITIRPATERESAALSTS